jgi:hypothetical protein
MHDLACAVAAAAAAVRRYPVRMVLVDLACPPPWFVQQQAHDHLQLQQAAAFAGTDGEWLWL